LPRTVRTFGCSWSAYSREDYDLVLAPNAEDAMDRLDTGPFDLLLLDIKLGDGRSGTELLHLLHERTPGHQWPGARLPRQQISVPAMKTGRAGASWASVATLPIGKQSQRSLERSRKRLRSLYQELPDAVILYDADGNVPEVNDQTVDDLGYSQAALLSMNVARIEAGLDAEDLQDIWGSMEGGDRHKVSSRHRRKDGTGFGLAIEKRIAEAHGWAAPLTEADSGGARVEFSGVEVLSS
jgi:PAS domain S-box-containing protein